MDQHDDIQLVDLIKLGDEDAFEELLKRYNPLIENACNLYYFPDGDRNDVRQVARLALWEAAKAFQPLDVQWYKPGKGFARFAKMVVYRKIIATLKGCTTKKANFLTQSCSLDQIREPFVEDDCEEVFPEFQEILTNMEKAAFFMRLDGYSHPEIGERLQISPKAVDNALQRARIKGKLVLSEQI